VLKKQVFQIEAIYVPVKRAKTLDAEKVDQIAESILEDGQMAPIRVRADGERFVLVEGLHRLEAMKALGEKTIEGYLVQAQKH
jgi:sulfiredoxin